MVRIYASDIEGFTLDDWEEMIGCGARADGEWEKWSEHGKAKFELEEHYGTRDLPERSFLFIMDEERKEPVEWSAELKSLIDDIIRVKPVKSPLYRAGLNVWDATLKEGMEIAAETFMEFYDGAMGRAFLRLMAELQGVAHEYPLAAE